jgi:5'-phosphate synthase pdxT subunit
VIPGGESTSISRVMLDYDLTDTIRKLAAKGLPVWGTCAGMILLAKNISDGEKVEPLRLMDITVQRNAFGRQVDSFEADLDVPALADGPFHAVFIRAPLIEAVGKGVEVLARLPDGGIVAVRQRKLLGTAFHPELTDDLRFHRYFLKMAGS